MKRYIIYNFTNLVLLIIFVVLIIFNNYNSLLLHNSNDFWFYSLCMGFGISLLIKSIIFRSDSSLWFGTNLFLNGTTMFVMNFVNVDYTLLWPLIITYMALGSFVVGLFFKDWFQYKLALIFLILNIAPIVYMCNLISFVQFVIAEILAIILAIIGHFTISKLYFYIKRRNNG